MCTCRLNLNNHPNLAKTPKKFCTFPVHRRIFALPPRVVGNAEVRPMSVGWQGSAELRAAARWLKNLGRRFYISKSLTFCITKKSLLILIGIL